MKPLGPIEWGVDVVIVVVFVSLCLLVLVLVAFDKPKWFHDICDPDNFSKPSGSHIS